MSMMIGESKRANPTVHVPPWTAEIVSPLTSNTDYSFLEALQHCVPDSEDGLLDLYSSDHFRMFEFKIRRCARGRSHDWTECPYAHPGEKARRRDPRKYHYSGAACPDFRKGSCKKGDACEFAHGVFECWLHPARYRTQPCKDGTSCRRRVCFFAHTPEEQRRVLTQQSVNSSSAAHSYDGESSSKTPLPFISSSPPMALSSLVVSLRNLQLCKMKSLPSSWNVPLGSSPRFRSVFCSLPSTPTQEGRCGGDLWEQSFEEEPVMERVESGRDIRAKMFEKLSKENSLDRSGLDGAPDVGWVSDLVSPFY